MPTVSIHMPEQSGQTGQSLYLRKVSDGTLINAGGDSLTEDPAGSGRFVATVAETISETLHAAVVSDGLTVRDGWVAAGETIVRDAYPASDVAQQTTLLEVQDAVDAYIASVVASVDGSAGTIVGFPESLNIGDSYTQDSGNAINVYIRDSDDNPISSVGTHAFTDPDFAPELTIASSGNVGRVRATLEYVDPGAPAEPYLRVELPSKETRRAVEGVATMQCVLKWDDCQKTIATQSVTWVARV